jgi:hypothetical protein
VNVPRSDTRLSNMPYCTAAAVTMITPAVSSAETRLWATMPEPVVAVVLIRRPPVAVSVLTE